jgi:hypothetical protein
MRPAERRLVHGFAIFEGIAFLGALILFLVRIGNTLMRIDRVRPPAQPAGGVSTPRRSLSSPGSRVGARQTP